MIGDCMLGPEVWARLAYRLFDAEQRLVEDGGDADALEVLLGFARLPPAIEAALEGLTAGERAQVSLSPAEGFGERDPVQMIWVDRDELPADVRIGDELEAERDGGGVVFLRVVELEEDCARLDANHPLAGQTVTLELEVLEARPATRAEVDAAESALHETAETPGAALVPVADLLRSRARQDRASEG